MNANSMNESHSEQFGELDRRRDKEQRRFYARRPKRIDNVIAQVVQRRGYAQVRAASDREAAWAEAVGEFASATRLGTLRRGTLEIQVESSLLMQELTFRKEELIAKLQTALPDAGIRQLRFRVGQVSGKES